MTTKIYKPKDLSLVVENGWTNYGAMNPIKVYTAEFGYVPNQFGMNIGDSEVMHDKLTSELLDEIFGSDVEIIKNLFRRDYTSTSASDDDIPDYEYSSSRIFGEHVESSVHIIDRFKKRLVGIGRNSLIVYYGEEDCFDYEKYLNSILEKLPINDEHNDSDAKIEIVSYDNGSYYTIESKINSVTINIDENYNDDFAKPMKNIIDFIGTEGRKSGLVLLNGEPGTGKTYFIRHLITNVPGKYILIPSSLCSTLSSPDFMSFLVEHKDSTFILEDCEEAIKDRGTTSFNSAVSAILNMADGIMSDIINAKFICTFNCDIADIDDAILRKGRCVEKYEFKALSKEKTKRLLEKLGKDSSGYNELTLADIYNQDIDNNVDNKKTKKIGF